MLSHFTLQPTPWDSCVLSRLKFLLPESMPHSSVFPTSYLADHLCALRFHTASSEKSSLSTFQVVSSRFPYYFVLPYTMALIPLQWFWCLFHFAFSLYPLSAESVPYSTLAPKALVTALHTADLWWIPARWVTCLRFSTQSKGATIQTQILFLQVKYCTEGKPTKQTKKQSKQTKKPKWPHCRNDENSLFSVDGQDIALNL